MLEKCLNNKINQIDFKSFSKKLIERIKENEENIKGVNEIDKKYYDKIIDVNDFIKIIEEYNDRKIVEKNKNILCIYNGNPEITLRLCIEAVLLQTNFILGIQDFMVGVNTLIVEIVNDILKKQNSKIFMFNLIKFEDVKNLNEKIDKILCIGNTNEYLKLAENNLSKLDFYPYKSLDIYCEDDELESLQRMIYDYSMTNQYEIEVYLKDNIDNIIGQMNEFGNGYCSVLLSKNKENIKKFEQEIESEIICINESPYNKIRFEIEKYI